MADNPPVVLATAAPARQGRLEPDAIGVAQDTLIGMASAAPTVSVGLTLATLAAVTAYGGGPVIVLCGAAMLVIAFTDRKNSNMASDLR